MNKQAAEEVNARAFAYALASLDELEEAVKQFPAFHSAHEGYAVLLEEVDELWEAVRANDRTRQREEAIQVVAMGLRFLAEVCEEPGEESEPGMQEVPLGQEGYFVDNDPDGDHACEDLKGARHGQDIDEPEGDSVA
jgi:NTP pyrophosphatase (non-canonical NTP hydrolase)